MPTPTSRKKAESWPGAYCSSGVVLKEQISKNTIDAMADSAIMKNADF